MKPSNPHYCQITERLDGIRMTPAERLAARTCLEQGALIADLTCRVGAWLRLLAAHVGRGIRGWARHAR